MKFGQWLGFFSFIISLYILWQIQKLLLLIFTAVVLCVALNRVVRRFQQVGMRRNLAILLTLTLCFVLAFLFFSLVVPPFIEQFQKLIELLPAAWERVRIALTNLRNQTLQFDWLPSLPSKEDLIDELQPFGTAVFKNFFAIFSNSLTAILQLLLVLVLAVMILFNPQSYRQAFLLLFPSFYRRRAEEILTLSEAALGNWLVGIILDSAFVALLSGVGLFFLGIKLVLVHALLAGLLNFIPNIGPTASMIFPIMIAALYDPWKIIIIIILYIIIQNIEAYLLAPTIMAQQVSLLPAVTLLAQIFFAQVFGLLGLLLALPLTVVIKVWLEETLFKDILDKWQAKSDQSYELAYFPLDALPKYTEDYEKEDL